MGHQAVWPWSPAGTDYVNSLSTICWSIVILNECDADKAFSAVFCSSEKSLNPNFKVTVKVKVIQLICLCFLVDHFNRSFSWSHVCHMPIYHFIVLSVLTRALLFKFIFASSKLPLIYNSFIATNFPALIAFVSYYTLRHFPVNKGFINWKNGYYFGPTHCFCWSEYSLYLLL